MRTLVQAAKMFEGELYPTASSVIPFLDTVFDDLKTLSGNVEGAAKIYVDTLLANLKSNKRFPGGYKNVAPFNCLTLLDIRCVILHFLKLILIMIMLIMMNTFLVLLGMLTSTSPKKNTRKLLTI
jgi:hypothetical protein